MSGPVTGPLLELRRLAVSFATDDGTVHAVDGIDLAVLSLTSPGVQAFDAVTATELAAQSNDVLAAAVKKYPVT